MGMTGDSSPLLAPVWEGASGGNLCRELKKRKQAVTAVSLQP